MYIFMLINRANCDGRFFSRRVSSKMYTDSGTYTSSSSYAAIHADKHQKVRRKAVQQCRALDICCEVHWQRGVRPLYVSVNGV